MQVGEGDPDSVDQQARGGSLGEVGQRVCGELPTVVLSGGWWGRHQSPFGVFGEHADKLRWQSGCVSQVLEDHIESAGAPADDPAMLVQQSGEGAVGGVDSDRFDPGAQSDRGAAGIAPLVVGRSG